MSDKLDFLEQSGTEEPRVEAETPQPAPEPQVEAAEQAQEPTEAPPAPQRGPDGKFLPKETEAAPEAPTPPPAAPKGDPLPGISALLDEREKRQALERQVAELKAKQAPPPEMTPDDVRKAEMFQMNMRMSRKFAEKNYGAETLSKVHDWASARCDADPIFNQQMLSSDDPYEAAMQAYNREEILKVVTPGDLEAFRSWQAAQSAVHGGAPPPSQQSSQPIPRSLATASGTGSLGKDAVPLQDGAGFMAAIPG